MQFDSTYFTHPGYKRELNEDSFLCDDKNSLWIVCDGMGGHSNGNFASRLITDLFEDIIFSNSFSQNIELIQNCLVKAHKILQKKVNINSSDIIGTTIVLLYIFENRAICIHCGDSRCYLFQNSLKCITKDHAKQLNGQRVLTSAINAPNKKLSLEKRTFYINENDKFLLCTDGLYDFISEDVILYSMRQKDIDKSMDILIKNVLKTKAEDNITALLIGKSFK
ncbi:PP2C family serine/threonine-protein phosphatase [Arcobacter sp. CECT 8985]|uniref:PP2C family protein-serine/threonine phosphatase n=1 Tax=Arcobacter sp. CECT 8985 TaxID=1935424 RepID=UPI00100A2BB6|nr:PP2C family serine/threonine-protein phosphatase [Arcobacter sp. CECT 8985]RXJ87628.1 hypothetical protein CRU93_03600 [Arcobacter sp. CECT 8985]